MLGSAPVETAMPPRSENPAAEYYRKSSRAFFSAQRSEVPPEAFALTYGPFGPICRRLAVKALASDLGLELAELSLEEF